MIMSGNYNYFVEVTTQGQLPYQNSSICINAYNNEYKSKSIMISVYWQKVRNNEIINLTGNMSNTYEVQADDVGMNIIANINS
jgi:hypothetical protein